MIGTCDANSAIDISFVQPTEDNKLKTISSFQPQFTYPIFGEDETIFGYKGLIIKLRFAAHDLRSNIHISYDERFQTVKDIAAVDLIKTLKPFLPEGTHSLPSDTIRASKALTVK
jgi:histone acetyltransferase 1